MKISRRKNSVKRQTERYRLQTILNKTPNNIFVKLFLDWRK
jgi:hypothetical protein